MGELSSPLVTRTLLACLFGLVLIQTAKFAGLAPLQTEKVLVDFDAFHIVGRMIWRGQLDAAYAFETLHRAQRAASDTDSFMPWTYPPSFDLVVAPLGLLPLWLAYLLFVGTTLSAFLLVLRRLAGEGFGVVLLAAAPALIVCTICGQNGLLTGTLVGLAALGLMRDRESAGLPLGLMAIKPHLALGLALNVLLARRWRVAMLAAAIVLGLAGLATLGFGTSVWTAFLGGLREARVFLEAGLYPMYRMVSIYAFLLALGIPAMAAMAAQTAVALVALAGIGLAMRRGMGPHRVLGLSLLAGLMVSPYAYDYDLPIGAVGLALLLPDLIRLTRPREQMLLLALAWTACGWGFLQTTIIWWLYGADGPPDGVTPLSLGGAALAVLLVRIWQVLERDRRAAVETLPVSEPVAA